MNSITALVLWDRLDAMLGAFISEQQSSLEHAIQAEMENGSQILGPYEAYDKETSQRLYVHLWSESSFVLNGICREYRIEYFHFLQPIPAWPGGKVFSDEEKAKGINRAERDEVKIATYKAMLNQGAAMKAKGINFYPLVDIYKRTRETAYVDSCCHMSAKGKRGLSEAIGDVLKEYYGKHPAAKQKVQ